MNQTIERARALLNDPSATKEQLDAAYTELDVIVQSLTELLQSIQLASIVSVPGVPQIIGPERNVAAKQLYDAILRQKADVSS